MTAMDTLFDDVAANAPGAAAAIVEAGKVSWQGCFGLASTATGAPITPDTRFRIASMTKPMVAMVVLALADAGALALSDPVTRWLPELRVPEPPTLAQLLAMQSGLPEGAPLHWLVTGHSACAGLSSGGRAGAATAAAHPAFHSGHPHALCQQQLPAAAAGGGTRRRPAAGGAAGGACLRPRRHGDGAAPRWPDAGAGSDGARPCEHAGGLRAARPRSRLWRRRRRGGDARRHDRLDTLVAGRSARLAGAIGRRGAAQRWHRLRLCAGLHAADAGRAADAGPFRPDRSLGRRVPARPGSRAAPPSCWAIAAISTGSNGCASC